MPDPLGTRYDMMGSGGGWMTGFAVLTVVLLLIAVLAILANLFLHVSTGRSAGRGQLVAGGPAPAGALPESRIVLDGRLARGEVAPEEYQTLRSLLDG